MSDGIDAIAFAASLLFRRQGRQVIEALFEGRFSIALTGFRTHAKAKGRFPIFFFAFLGSLTCPLGG
ncbi:MAG: hypothetical protein V3V20_00995 [Algisphaera sp.]